VRALVDANLLINALLSESEAVCSSGDAGRGETGVISSDRSPEALEEASRVVGAKPWIVSRVSPEEVATFWEVIATIAEVPQRLEQLPPPLCRDPADDYLIAHAILASADGLVTRDRGLLDLGEVAGMRIVDAATFLRLLHSETE
jgi:predicted nucleic acid-binding protein